MYSTAPWCFELLLAAVIAITACGCQPRYHFQGRVLIVNATREAMESLVLIVDGQETTLATTADGQAWIKPVCASRSIGFRWKTAADMTGGVSEPIEDLVPELTRGDLMIKILAAGSMQVALCELPK